MNSGYSSTISPAPLEFSLLDSTVIRCKWIQYSNLITLNESSHSSKDNFSSSDCSTAALLGFINGFGWQSRVPWVKTAERLIVR